MDDPSFVSRLEHPAKLTQQAADALCRKGAILLDHVVQGNAGDILHDDARPAPVTQGGIVQGHGVKMVKASHQAHLTLEALAEAWLGGELVVHDLDDDLPIHVELPAEVNAAHAALAEQLNGLVTTQVHLARRLLS